MSNPRRVFILLLLTAFLCLYAPAGADDEAPADGRGGATSGRARDRDVVMAVRAPHTITQAELEARLETALESAKTPVDSLNVRPMEFETYERIRSFLNEVDIDAPPPESDEVVIRKAPRGWTWSIYLPRGYRVVEKLEVVYDDDDGPGKKATFKPVSIADAKNDPDARLSYATLNPPVLELRADEDWKLKSYTVDLAPWQGKPAKQIKGEFARDVCFRLEIVGYRGTLNELFEVLADANRIGVPLKGIQAPKTLALGIADLIAPLPPEGGIWSDRIFRMFVTPPVKPKVDRAWVLFPVTKEQADKLTEELTKQLRSGKLTSRKLSEQLGAGSLGGFVTSPERVEKVELQPGNVLPKWHVLYETDPNRADQVRQFSGQFLVQNVQGWKDDPRKDEAWRVMMFEFDVRDGAGNKTGSKVIVPTKLVGDQSAPASYFHSHKVEGWSTGASPFRTMPAAAPAAD